MIKKFEVDKYKKEINLIKKYIKKNNLTIKDFSHQTGYKYETLRKVLCFKRKYTNINIPLLLQVLNKKNEDFINNNFSIYTLFSNLNLHQITRRYIINLVYILNLCNKIEEPFISLRKIFFIYPKYEKYFLKALEVLKTNNLIKYNKNFILLEKRIIPIKIPKKKESRILNNLLNYYYNKKEYTKCFKLSLLIKNLTMKQREFYLFNILDFYYKKNDIDNIFNYLNLFFNWLKKNKKNKSKKFKIFYNALMINIHFQNQQLLKGFHFLNNLLINLHKNSIFLLKNLSKPISLNLYNYFCFTHKHQKKCFKSYIIKSFNFMMSIFIEFRMYDYFFYFYNFFIEKFIKIDHNYNSYLLESISELANYYGNSSTFNYFIKFYYKSDKFNKSKLIENIDVDNIYINKVNIKYYLINLILEKDKKKISYFFSNHLIKINKIILKNNNIFIINSFIKKYIEMNIVIGNFEKAFFFTLYLMVNNNIWYNLYEGYTLINIILINILKENRFEILNYKMGQLCDKYNKEDLFQNKNFLNNFVNLFFNRLNPEILNKTNFTVFEYVKSLTLLEIILFISDIFLEKIIKLKQDIIENYKKFNSIKITIFKKIYNNLKNNNGQIHTTTFIKSLKEKNQVFLNHELNYKDFLYFNRISKLTFGLLKKISYYKEFEVFNLFFQNLQKILSKNKNNIKYKIIENQKTKFFYFKTKSDHENYLKSFFLSFNFKSQTKFKTYIIDYIYKYFNYYHYQLLEENKKINDILYNNSIFDKKASFKLKLFLKKRDFISDYINFIKIDPFNPFLKYSRINLII